MKLIVNGNTTIAVSTYDERAIPKTAGFRWNPDTKKWYTTDPVVAMRLSQYADSQTLQAIQALGADKIQKIEASRAATVENFEPPKPEGLEYMPFQKAGIAYGKDRANVLFGDEMGLGKGCVENTPVLTPNGWIEIGKLCVGDIVIGGSTGKSAQVTGVYPQGVKNVFRFLFDDNTSVVVDEDHLWNVRDDNDYRRKSGCWRTLSTRDLLKTNLNCSGFPRWEIPFVPPVEFSSKDKLPVDPYLLGVLLGNGNLLSSPKISTIHSEQIDLIRDLIPSGLTIKDAPFSDPNIYGITGKRSGGHCKNQLTEGLKAIGVWGKRDFEKLIPEQYLYTSSANRLALLQGLLDTDGTTKDARVRFSSCSEKMANQVIWIVRSLGGWASKSIVEPRLPRSPLPNYFVCVQLPEGMHAFRLQYHLDRTRVRKRRAVRKIISIEPCGQAKTVCISVDDPCQLYVVNDFIVTHNTIQAIGLINCDESLIKILIVCPASLRINWKRELTKWLVRSMSISIANGSIEDTQIVIINYDLLKKHKGTLLATKFDLVILDESHYIKNQKAQRTKLALEIAKNCRRRFFLTGTPILNRPKEIFTTISLLCPEPFSWKGKLSFFGFAKRYCAAVQTKYGWDFDGASHLDELQEKLRIACMVRRLKKDVLTELPAKRRAVLELPANGCRGQVEIERRAFQAYSERRSELQSQVDLALANEDENSYKNAVEELRSSAQIFFTEISKLRHETAVAKMPAVIAYIEDALEGIDKLVVFAHHHDVIDGICEAMNAKEKIAVRVDGRMDARDRQISIDSFQTDPKVKVFVGSITAAGVGITLTAASNVIFAELDWVPGNVSQAEDRLHRIGQTESVNIVHLVLEDSIDAIMAQTIVSKQEVIDMALDKKSVANPEVEDGILAAVSQAMVSVDATKQTQEDKDWENTKYLKSMGKEPVEIDPELADAVHAALRLLSGVCDGARVLDDCGFNKFDSVIGKAIAKNISLSFTQVMLGKKILKKYHRQIPADLYSRIYK